MPLRPTANRRKVITMKPFVMAAVLLGGFSASVGSASEGDHEDARRLREAGEIVPLEQILPDARSRHGGHIIEIELERENGRYVYEVEFVDEAGQVHEYYYDAGDGRFLREKRGETKD